MATTAHPMSGFFMNLRHFLFPPRSALVDAAAFHDVSQVNHFLAKKINPNHVGLSDTSHRVETPLDQATRWAADRGNSDASKRDGLAIMAALIGAGAKVTPTCVTLALDCAVEMAHSAAQSSDRPHLMRLLELLHRGGVRWDLMTDDYGKPQTRAQCLAAYFPEGLAAIGVADETVDKTAR
jgi:hypothetical protein